MLSRLSSHHAVSSVVSALIVFSSLSLVESRLFGFSQYLVTLALASGSALQYAILLNRVLGGKLVSLEPHLLSLTVTFTVL